MLPLAAFADEISPDLDVQIRACQANSVTHIELRGVNDRNVLDFDIKDARWSDGQVLPAGQGDAQLEPILTDAWSSGYRGFLSLEPHLKAAGQYSGHSGPDAFKVAADALKALCAKIGIPLAGVK